MAPGNHLDDHTLYGIWIESEVVKDYLVLAEQNKGTDAAREAALCEFGRLFFDRKEKRKETAWSRPEFYLLLIAIFARCAAAGLSRSLREPNGAASIALFAALEVLTLCGLVMDLYFKVNARKFTLRLQVLVAFCKLMQSFANVSSTMLSGITEVGYHLSVSWATTKCVAELCTAFAAITKLCKIGRQLYVNEGRSGIVDALIHDKPNAKLEWTLVPDSYKQWADRLLYQLEIYKIHTYHTDSVRDFCHTVENLFGRPEDRQ